MIANAMEPNPPIPLYKLTQNTNQMYFKKMQRLREKHNPISEIALPTCEDDKPKFKSWL
jgi:hypothetical protein